MDSGEPWRYTGAMTLHLQERAIDGASEQRRVQEFVDQLWRTESSPIAPLPSQVAARWTQVGELRGWLNGAEEFAGVAHRLVEADGVSRLELAIHPEHREMVLFESMLAWVLDHAAIDRGDTTEAHSRVRLRAPESDVSIPFMLLRLNFVTLEGDGYTLWSPSSEPVAGISPAVSHLPDGLRTRLESLPDGRRVLLTDGEGTDATVELELVGAGFEVLDRWVAYTATLNSREVRHSTE